MNNKKYFTLMFYLLCLCFPEDIFAKVSNVSMTSDQYQRVLKKQNAIHLYLQRAFQHEKQEQSKLALENYLKAYEIDQCAGLVAVCRGGLADNYEALGNYKEALGHVEWFLKELKPAEPLYAETVAARERLLRKIKAQERDEKI
jgi:tetratricopeptide (TPR) repeat protein